MFKLLLLSTLAFAGPRLVSTSPQVTEILFQLGRGKDLVATSDFSDFPEAAKKLPYIGPPFAFGVETIARYLPDWVLTEPNAAPTSTERGLRALGVKQFSMPINTVDDLYSQSDRLLKEIYPGEKVALPARAPLPREKKPFTFLAFTWMDPPILFGHTTFLSDLLVQLGGKNLLPTGWTSPYPRVSLEWILKQKVSRIYFLADMGPTVERGREIAKNWWPKENLPAIPLSGAHFGRASFTPLQYVGELSP